MTQTNTSPNTERHFVGGIAFNPAMLGSYPAHELLTDPISRSALKAVSILKTADPSALAEAMARNGWPDATPEEVYNLIIKPAEEHPCDIPATYRFLSDLYLLRTGVPLFDQYKTAVQAGHMGILEAAREMQQAILGKGGLQELKGVSTTDASTYLAQVAAEQRERSASGNIAKFAPQFRDIYGKIRSLDKGIMSVLFDTSRGKTILMQILAEERARNHGRNAIFAMSEATIEEMLWRSITRRIGIPYDELEAGLDDERTRKASEPFKNGSYIKYVQAAGFPLTSLLSVAEQNDADLYVDVFYDVDCDEFMKRGGTNSNMYSKALGAMEGYCQRRKRLCAITLQTDKEGRRRARSQGRERGYLQFEDCKEGTVFEDKSALALIGNSKKAEGRTEIKHPITGRIQVVNDGWYLPVVNIQPAKNRLGGGLGLSQLAFLDGPRFDLVPINRPRDENDDEPNQFEFYKEYV